MPCFGCFWNRRIYPEGAVIDQFINSKNKSYSFTCSIIDGHPQWKSEFSKNSYLSPSKYCLAFNGKYSPGFVNANGYISVVFKYRDQSKRNKLVLPGRYTSKLISLEELNKYRTDLPIAPKPERLPTFGF